MEAVAEKRTQEGRKTCRQKKLSTTCYPLDRNVQLEDKCTVSDIPLNAQNVFGFSG